MPACCAVAPACLVRVVYGNFPIGDGPDGIRYGMTADELRAALGPPHEVLGSGSDERWVYWRDSFGDDYVGVYFDSEGRVRTTWVP